MSRKKRDIPVFSHPIVETHCHLDYLKDAELSQILDDARAVGIERIVTIAVEPDNLGRVRDLTEEHAMIYGTQGIHPHDADHYTEATDAELRQHGNDDKIVAIGEIGLDYHYDHSDRAKQRQVFADQLKIACELDKPVVIHTRDADEDTQAILADYVPHLKRKGVIHSFTSGIDLAQYCLEQGFMLGFNGIITFNKAENVREVLAATPIEQLVVETDSPFLTPVPYRGQENAPKFLPFVIEKIADVKQLPVDQVLKQSYQNAQRLFGWA
ncbi:hydrolase TatD [Saccharospirillum sp. MSK14-1]|uniref:TatD family hydrolase n=1 Tax=Saccharospirillum sp. MSK14-1 TaxID=1897632 RepID=UPI000D340E30|nr:TatD family hydrolase [Saccharospirillum sp. MSK14-1]PTY37713.1 hydrolase TatD [Saccharospirillum sp. MSK14-1]